MLLGMSDERTRFGRRLQAYRDARQLTQPELARRVSVHPVTIAKWEGGTQEPSGSKLLALSAALRVSPAVLMGQPRRATEAAITAYVASPYHATLEAEGKPLGPQELDSLRYLIDSRWFEGAPTPRLLHAMVRLIREEPAFFQPAGPDSGEAE